MDSTKPWLGKTQTLMSGCAHFLQTLQVLDMPAAGSHCQRLAVLDVITVGVQLLQAQQPLKPPSEQRQDQHLAALCVLRLTVSPLQQLLWQCSLSSTGFLTLVSALCCR